MTIQGDGGGAGEEVCGEGDGDEASPVVMPLRIGVQTSGKNARNTSIYKPPVPTPMSVFSVCLHKFAFFEAVPKVSILPQYFELMDSKVVVFCQSSVVEAVVLSRRTYHFILKCNKSAFKLVIT